MAAKSEQMLKRARERENEAEVNRLLYQIGSLVYDAVTQRWYYSHAEVARGANRGGEELAQEVKARVRR